MKNTGKRILSLLLTAVVLLSLLSVSALADTFDPLAGLASLGEFTQPETEGQEVADADASALNQNADAILVQEAKSVPAAAENAVPEETVPDDGKLRIYTTDKGLHLTIDGSTSVEPVVPAEREVAVYGRVGRTAVRNRRRDRGCSIDYRLFGFGCDLCGYQWIHVKLYGRTIFRSSTADTCQICIAESKTAFVLGPVINCNNGM